MTEKQRRITKCVNDAIRDFNMHESYLISRDLSERCICAKFMRYLETTLSESEFNDYVADVEYNRGHNGNEYSAKILHGRKIVVDLIAHKRGFSKENGFDNLLCIEMKKAYKNADMSSDKERLQILTNSQFGFGYKAGFMIVAFANKKQGQYGLAIDTSFYNPIDG
jgi:hypothetical protein